MAYENPYRSPIANAADAYPPAATFAPTQVGMERIFASTWGVFYTSGRYTAGADASHFGSVIAGQSIDHDGSIGSPVFRWDRAISEAWPPEGWTMPRVFVTRWRVDP